MGKLGGEIDKKQFAYAEEPFWLAEWVLGDVAERRPSKRQRESMSGMWLSRQGKNLGIRGSDQIERNYVATLAMMSGGYTTKKAVCEIGEHLGKTTAKELDVLRAGIYRLRSPFKNQLLRMWLENFRGWTDWVVSSPENTLEFVATQFRAKGKPRQARQFLKLAGRVRAKVIALGRTSLYRDASWYERAEQICQYRILADEESIGTGPDQHFIGMG